MPPLSFEKRQELVNRINGGQRIGGPTGIAAEMKIAVKTIYRLKEKFTQPDGSFEAQAAVVARKQAFTRETLVEISQWLQAEPKLTLKELRERLVEQGIYGSLDTVPDASTLWRQLKSMGFDWRKPKYSDPRAKRDVIKYERCSFRLAQDNGLDPTTLLSIDESNFYYEQATRAWGTDARPATLEKPKGKVMRRSMIATIAFKMVRGEPKCIIHWVLVLPRRSWRPLSDVIEAHEIKQGEKSTIKENLTPQLVNSLSRAGLAAELKKLDIRSGENTEDSMRDTLLSVLRRGTREGQLRARGKGRPTAGGSLTPPTGDARMVSEYLYSCLVPYLKTGRLHNEHGNECATSIDEGIESCPDGGKWEYKPRLGEMSILWDSAPSHMPSNHVQISAFHKYAQDKLGLRGVVHTPPYSAWFNPVELLFSYVKRYCRKFAPPDIPSLLQRIREATGHITASMVAGWFRKSGYIIPGEAPREDAPDPNAGAERCTLSADAIFERREHVACFDEAGKLRREKKQGHKRWSQYDTMEDEEAANLRNLSAVKRTAVRPKKRARVGACAPPEEGHTRWTGLGPEPKGAQHADYSKLWDRNQYNEVEAIVDERVRSGKTEYFTKWLGYDETYNEWLSEDKFSAGSTSLIRGWRERNRRLAEAKEFKEHEEEAKTADRPVSAKPINRTRFKKGDVVAVLSKNKDRLFNLARVDEVFSDKLRVHWFGSKRLDSTYTLEYSQKQGKGVGPPNIGTIWKETVVDSVTSMATKSKGKIEKDELTRLVALSQEANRK